MYRDLNTKKPNTEQNLLCNDYVMYYLQDHQKIIYLKGPASGLLGLLILLSLQ
ncbi:hypothetical protein C1646_754695 [Rhizophagus diaphanus]|nr:hypothetical protein C1646_754695 [Rhizophagus diaphanus] [Rhizophagus sp. MUCL 43196]